MLRGVLFGRIALGNATFQQSHSRSLIDEEHEDSCGVSRKRARSNAEWRAPRFRQSLPKSFRTVVNARTNARIALVLRFGGRC